MYIRIDNCYGIEGKSAWYREEGEVCYSFVFDRKDATNLDAVEARRIFDNKTYYLCGHQANKMVIETA